MADSTAVPKQEEIDRLRTQVKLLSLTVRLFANTENWERDNVWAPAVQTMESRFPDQIASRTLEACGL